MLRPNPYLVFPFFLLALIAGVFGGLTRMGWAFPSPVLPAYHGVLMTGGFLGGLITLERTITMKNKGWLIFPACCALSTILLLFQQDLWGAIALSAGSAGLISFYLVQIARHEDRYWYVMVAGALFWLMGNLRWMSTGFIPSAVSWWIGFILFTILGERLELSRFAPVPKAARHMLWVALILLGLSFFLPFHSSWGGTSCALLTLVVTSWFLRFDIAWLSARKEGYFRYTGISMLVAYGWLLLHGLSILFLNERPFFYDLYIHTFFLGFAFSMIWAHAPLILPAVFRVKVRPYHWVLWVFWVLFQLSLLGRILASLIASRELRMISGMTNGISVFLMLLTVVILMIIKNRGKKKDEPLFTSTPAIRHPR